MDRLFQEHPDLANSLQGSLHNRVAFGAEAGRYVTRIGSGFGYREEIPVMKGRLCLSQNGFSIHGARVIRTNDRKGLEQLVSYMARPAISVERLSMTSEGNVRYALKTRWHDGTEAVEFTPIDFLSRLAALVPPPRVHMIKYAGIFAPNHPIRNKVILNRGVKKGKPPKCEDDEVQEGGRKKVRNSSWARLLRRIFQIDVGSCTKCGSEMEIMGAVFDWNQVRRYLDHVGLARSPPGETHHSALNMVYLPL